MAFGAVKSKEKVNSKLIMSLCYFKKKLFAIPVFSCQNRSPCSAIRLPWAAVVICVPSGFCHCVLVESKRIELLSANIPFRVFKHVETIRDPVSYAKDSNLVDPAFMSLRLKRTCTVRATSVLESITYRYYITCFKPSFVRTYML